MPLWKQKYDGGKGSHCECFDACICLTGYGENCAFVVLLRNAISDSCTPLVFVGAKVRAEIYEAFENIYPILKGFRKTT